MCHKLKFFLSATMMLLMMNSAIEARRQHCPRRSLKIIGVVVAYSQVAALVNITDAPQQQVLLVRADRSISGEEPAHYLRVVYRYGIDEASLPDAVFDGKSKWQFRITRDCGCDGSLGENRSRIENEITLPTWRQTGAGEEIPRDVKLPCYLLRPKGLRPSAEKPHKS
jgi:hypothetical protein